MNGIMGLVVLGSAIWMAVDSAQLGYDRRDIRGLAAMGPAGWFFAGLLLWIVAFPLYLVKRGELKTAGEMRRQGLAGGPGGFLPQGQPYPQQPYPQQQYPQQQYPQQQYPQQQYPQQQYPQQQYPQQQYPQQQYPQQQYPQQQYPQQQPYPQQPSPMTADEVAHAIVKLGQMLEAGLLTEAEFQQQKSQILARMA